MRYCEVMEGALSARRQEVVPLHVSGRGSRYWSDLRCLVATGI